MGAIDADKDWVCEGGARWLAHGYLQLCSGQDVEELLGRPELHVSVEVDRVVALQEGVEELMQPDWLSAVKAAPRVITRQELLNGKRGGSFQQVEGHERREPEVVGDNLGSVAIQDRENLLCVAGRRAGDLDL